MQTIVHCSILDSCKAASARESLQEQRGIESRACCSALLLCSVMGSVSKRFWRKSFSNYTMNGLRATTVVYQQSYALECLNPYMQMLLNHFFLDKKPPQLFKAHPMQCINNKPVWKERLLPGSFSTNSIFNISYMYCTVQFLYLCQYIQCDDF